MIKNKIFDDTKIAFKTKSDLELERAIFLFKLMDREILVKAGIFLAKLSLRFYLPLESLIKKTIFDQFCGGIDEDSCKYVTKAIFKENVHSILDYSVEGKETDEQFDFTLKKKIKLIKCFGK